MDIERLSPAIVLDYQKRVSDKKHMTIGEFKAVGRELRDTYGLSDRDALDLLNGRNVLEIMSKNEGD